jgi:hypothetical protein
MPKRALYRLYGSMAELLYIGVGIVPEYRVTSHRRKPWGHLIARVEIEWYPTDRAAAVAEKQAIRGEHPIHNRMRYSGGTFELNRDGTLGREI